MSLEFLAGSACSGRYACYVHWYVSGGTRLLGEAGSWHANSISALPQTGATRRCRDSRKDTICGVSTGGRCLARITMLVCSSAWRSSIRSSDIASSMLSFHRIWGSCVLLVPTSLGYARGILWHSNGCATGLISRAALGVRLYNHPAANLDKGIMFLSTSCRARLRLPSGAASRLLEYLDALECCETFFFFLGVSVHFFILLTICDMFERRRLARRVTERSTARGPNNKMRSLFLIIFPVRV